jgi:hypothetical protein
MRPPPSGSFAVETSHTPLGTFSVISPECIPLTNKLFHHLIDRLDHGVYRFKVFVERPVGGHNRQKLVAEWLQSHKAGSFNTHILDWNHAPNKHRTYGLRQGAWVHL